MPKNQLGFTYKGGAHYYPYHDRPYTAHAQQSSPRHAQAPSVFRNQLQFSTAAPSANDSLTLDDEKAVVINRDGTYQVGVSDSISVTSSVDLVLGQRDAGSKEAWGPVDPLETPTESDGDEGNFLRERNLLPASTMRKSRQVEADKRKPSPIKQRRRLWADRSALRADQEGEVRTRLQGRVEEKRTSTKSSIQQIRTGGTSKSASTSTRAQQGRRSARSPGRRVRMHSSSRDHPVHDLNAVHLKATRKSKKDWNNDTKTAGVFEKSPPRLFNRRRVPVPSRAKQNKLNQYKHKLNDIERAREHRRMEAEVAEATTRVGRRSSRSRSRSRSMREQDEAVLTEGEARDYSEAIADRSVSIIKRKVAQLENELDQETLANRGVDELAAEIRRANRSRSQITSQRTSNLRTRAYSSPTKQSRHATISSPGRGGARREAEQYNSSASNTRAPRVYKGGVTIDPDTRRSLFTHTSEDPQGSGMSRHAITLNHEAAAKLLAEQLIEKEVSRQAELDAIFQEAGHARQQEEEEIMHTLRETVAQRRAELTDEVKRPNYYLRQAEEELTKLQSRLFPLLNKAEDCMQRLHQHHYVNNLPLLKKFSRLAAEKIMANDEELADLIVDDILTETVQLLQEQEAQARREALVDQQRRQAGAVHKQLSEMDQKELELRRKYGLPTPPPVTSSTGTQVIRILDDSTHPSSEHIPPADSGLRDLMDNSHHDHQSLLSALADIHELHLEHQPVLPPDASGSPAIHTSTAPAPASPSKAGQVCAEQKRSQLEASWNDTASQHTPVKHNSPTKTATQRRLTKSCLNEADIGTIMANKSTFERYLLETASLASDHDQFFVIDKLCESIVDEVITSNAVELFSMCDDLASTLFKSEFGPLDMSQLSEA